MTTATREPISALCDRIEALAEKATRVTMTAETKRCPRCDTAECRAAALPWRDVGAYATGWAPAESNETDSRSLVESPGCSCAGAAVEWRARALAAERFAAIALALRLLLQEVATEAFEAGVDRGLWGAGACDPGADGTGTPGCTHREPPDAATMINRLCGPAPGETT